jgi:hypothetical protein
MKKKITKDDIFIKARMLAEGVRIQDRESPTEAAAVDESDLEQVDRMAVDDPEGLLRLLADANRAEGTDSALGNAVLLEGCGIPAPILPNDDSRLQLTMDGEKVIISEQGDVLSTGSFYTPHRPWSGEVLSNGMPVESVLPGMSSSIINILLNISCNNFNTGKGCRYCGLFANPVSRRLNELPISTLAQWSGYQAEAVKIITDRGWRGVLAISGGALPPSQKGEYLARLETAINPIREILDEKTFSELNLVYNFYPPEDFSDMYKWKELGINGTSIDQEVADPANFPTICPGKNSYKPHSYWQEAQEASVEVFGPLLHTTTDIVEGIEPMSSLVEAVDERLSKGVMPITLTFMPMPGSAMEDAKTPSAQWQVAAAEKMADCYIRHGAKFIKAVASELFADIYYHYAPGFIKDMGLYNGECGPSMLTGSIQTTHLTVVFDEILRRAQKLPWVTSMLKFDVA